MQSIMMPTVVAILALAVRCIGIGTRSFWLDEGFSTWLAAQPIDVILGFPDFHPPLYYLVIRAWESLGGWFASDAGIRMVSAIASALSIAIVTWLAQRVCPAKTLFVAAYGILSPMSIWYAQEARMYALASFAATGAVAALVWLRLDSTSGAGAFANRAIAWTAFVGLGLAAMYAHYDGVALILASSSVFLLLIWRQKSMLVAWSFTNLALLIGYFPQLRYVGETFERAGDFHLAARLPLLVALGVATVAGVWILIAVSRKSSGGGAIFWAALSVIGLSLAALVEISTFGSSLTRHATIVLPPGIVGAAFLLDRFRCRSTLQWIAVVACIPPLFMVLFVHQKEQWREAASLLADSAGPRDSVVIYQGYMSSVLGRYYRGPSGIIPINDPTEFEAMINAGSLSPRVWLIESHLGDSPSLEPLLARTRTQSTRTEFYRVSVSSFESPIAMLKDDGKRSSDSLSQMRSAN